MIGKILDDRWDWTEKIGGTKNETVKITTKVKFKELQQLKEAIRDCNTTAQVDVVIKEHGLSDIEGLPEHIKKLYEKGEIDNLETDDVNKFVNDQNYKNIANQANGYKGVKAAIDEYNESLIKNQDGTTKASDGTKRLSEAILQGNSSLGKYLISLNGSTTEIFSYGKYLATAAVKTFALQTATMALNSAVGFGVSFAISGIINAIINYANRVNNAIEASHKAKEAINEANSSFKTQQNLIKNSSRKYAELAQHVNQINNTNLDLKEDEYQSFLDLSNQIAEQFPGLIKGYDDNGNAILNLQGTINDINLTLDSYIDKAKEAAQIKIVQAFKGTGENEDYFQGAKYEVDKLNDKANEEKERKEKLEKLKETITLPDDDMTDLFGNYSSESDSRFKADHVRKYLKDSGLDKKLYDDSFLFGSLKNLSTDERIKFDNAINERDYDLDGKLSDSAILTINEILSKYSKESGYNFSDYITQQIKAATDDYNQFADDVETKNKEISQNAQAVLEQSVIWSNPDTMDKMKTTMTSALGQIDWSDSQFEGFDGEQAAHYKNYLKDNGIDSVPELNVWNKRTEGITNATEAISAYEKKAQEVSQNISKDNHLSFSEAWKAIGTSGDEEKDNAALEAKEKLLELAEAGKLTKEAFDKHSTPIKEDFLKQTGLSAKEATQEINELVSSASQLSSMKTGISSISNILGEKKQKQSSKKTQNKGIGPDTLDGMPEDK